MTTSTFSVSHTQTATYVAAKMLYTLKEIIREIGLDPGPFSRAAIWDLHERALNTWLRSRDLTGVSLEIYNPSTGELIRRWDITISYDTVGDGSLWVDGAAVRYAIKKAGLVASSCSYELLLSTKPGRPDVAGMSACKFRSTEGLRRYAIGSTLGGSGITGDTSYWSN